MSPGDPSKTQWTSPERALPTSSMDTLPYNGAFITLLAVIGLTHKQAGKDSFVINGIKTQAVFFVILVYDTTGIV